MNRPPTQVPLSRTTDIAMSAEPRAALIAKSLKNIARRSRTPRGILISSGTNPVRRWQHLFVWAIIASFFIVVAIPNLVAGIYLAFVASNQYATETRFAVRGGETSVLDQFGGMLGMQTAKRVQDSLIVTDYILSRGMITAIDETLNLRRVFARDHVDFFSRFNPKSSDEELMYYWRRHVDVNIDSISGIITVVVRAFTPQDSLAIANEITRLSEKLVNDLTERSRTDALKQATVELGRAKQNLQDKVVAMRDLRNAEGVIDTGKTGEVMTKMLGDLRLELIRMQQEYSANRHAVSADAPQMRVLEARITSMRDQIRDLESQMTGTGSKANAPLTKSIGRFEVAQLEKNIAEQTYVAAAAAYERARIELEAQNTYLASFLKPVMAQEALYPKRLALAAIVALITVLLWGGGLGAAVLVRNHVAT